MFHPRVHNNHDIQVIEIYSLSLLLNKNSYEVYFQHAPYLYHKMENCCAVYDNQTLLLQGGLHI